MDRITRTVFRNTIKGFAVDEPEGGEPTIRRADPIVTYSTTKLTDSAVAKIAKKHGIIKPEYECVSELMAMSLEDFVAAASVTYK